MITIFSCPKPFDNKLISTIQINAIKSWKCLKFNPEILLLGNENGVAKVARELKVKSISEITLNRNMIPLMSSIFEEAKKNSKNDIFCFINCDIILFDDIIEKITYIKEKFKSFLMIGKRWDLNIEELVNFNDKGVKKKIMEKISVSGKLHPPTGIDFFIFTKDLFEKVPKFVIGRGYTDSWLIWNAFSKKVPVIDISHDVIVVHQNHDYSHIKKSEIKKKIENNVKLEWSKSIEFDYNRKLAGNWLFRYDIRQATYKLENGLLKRKLIYNNTLTPIFTTLILFFIDRKGIAEFISHLPKIDRLLRLFRESSV